MNRRKSIIISAFGHVVIILLSVIVGLVARDKVLPPAPVNVNLLASVQDTTKQKGAIAEKKPKPKKEEPEIIERKKPEPKPTYNPTVDLKRLEELTKKAENEEAVKEPQRFDSARDHVGGMYGSSSAYESMIQQIIRNNWIQPSRAILGSDPPVVLVTIQVDRSGEILSSRITKSSGISRLDSSVSKAIEDSDPLPRLPSYVVGSPKTFNLRFIVED